MPQPSSCLNFLRFQPLKFLKSSYFFSRLEEIQVIQGQEFAILDGRSVILSAFY